MNNKKKEGSFYASKVRLFLNEYGGENLQEFCKTENGKCPKFGVIANLEVESVVNTFAVIIHLKLSHYGNDRLRKRV